MILKFATVAAASVAVPRPPLSVRVVADLELAFGVLLLLPAGMALIWVPLGVLGSRLTLLCAALVLTGSAWCVMAGRLLSGGLWARLACLVLSALRVLLLVGLPFPLVDPYLFGLRAFTLVGIPISFVSIYVLCRSPTARLYFVRQRASEATHNSASALRDEKP